MHMVMFGGHEDARKGGRITMCSISCIFIIFTFSKREVRLKEVTGMLENRNWEGRVPE